MEMPTPVSEINLIETFSDTKVIGLTLNHEDMTDVEVSSAIIRYQQELGIPVTDALSRSQSILWKWYSQHSLKLGKIISRGSLTAPRLEIDLDKIYHNARTLVSRLGERGISVTGVTKAALGSPEIANTWLRAGVRNLGDSRIENIATMRRANVAASMELIRSPMLSQLDLVVANAHLSYNTEIEVVRGLSSAASKANHTHGIILMVELGDLREGIMPEHLESAVRETLLLPNLVFQGIGSNLACRSGVSPDSRNMAALSRARR